MLYLKRAALVTLMLLVASPAWAIKDPETGVNFPDQTQCGGAKAKAAGVGVREATMGVDVYGVVLYVSTKALGKSVQATQECVKIRARFVREVGEGKIRDAWLKGFKKNGLSAGDATVKKFLGVIKGEIKEHKDMVMEVQKDRVIFSYMKKKVTITGAKKLATAVKRIYLGSGSPTPTLVKDVKKRGVARP
jgi:hypothetical protein